MKKYKNSYLSYFLMYTGYYLSWALFSAMISVYLMGKGLKASEVSLIVSMSYLTSMAAQPVTGILTDRIGVKKMNMILFGLAAAGGVEFLFADSFIMMLAGYSFVLTLLNASNPMMDRIATASPYKYGSIRVWGTIGYAAGTQLSGLIYEYISPAAVYAVFVITMLTGVLGTAGTEPAIETAAKDTGKKESPFVLFGNRKYLYFMLISCIMTAGTSVANTYTPAMFVEKGLPAGITSTILSLAVLCELPLVLFSYKFMDKVPNKTLIMISYTMYLIQFAVYAFDLPLPFMIAATLAAKHAAGMLYIMINLKVITTIVDRRHTMTALAFMAASKNLVSMLSQNIAGRMLDTAAYADVYKIYLAVMTAGWVLAYLFKVESGNEHKLFS